MEMPNAIKVCKSVGGYTKCDKCPIYAVCCKDYPNTEAFEKAVEKSATEHLTKKVQAKYFETFGGNDYFRDEHGNIYTKTGNEVAYCSNLKHGSLTEDKAEPSYPVNNVELIY